MHILKWKVGKDLRSTLEFMGWNSAVRNQISGVRRNTGDYYVYLVHKYEELRASRSQIMAVELVGAHPVVVLGTIP